VDLRPRLHVKTRAHLGVTRARLEVALRILKRVYHDLVASGGIAFSEAA